MQSLVAVERCAMKTTLKDDIYTIIASKRDISGNLQWVSRREIAQALGRAGLTLRADDIIALKHLASKRLIHSRHERITGGNGWQAWMYKAIES